MTPEPNDPNALYGKKMWLFIGEASECLDDLVEEEEDIYIGPRLQVRITGPGRLLPCCARQPAVRNYRGRKYVQWNGGLQVWSKRCAAQLVCNDLVDEITLRMARTTATLDRILWQVQSIVSFYKVGPICTRLTWEPLEMQDGQLNFR
jgi:hypothetical protein